MSRDVRPAAQWPARPKIALSNGALTETAPGRYAIGTGTASHVWDETSPGRYALSNASGASAPARLRRLGSRYLLIGGS